MLTFASVIKLCAMNLRDIKKKITLELGAFLEDCSIVAAVSEKNIDKQVENLLNEAIELHDELRDKVGMAEGNVKEYYMNLIKEVEDKTDALYQKLSDAVTASKNK